jgi:hypothetical protein
MKKSKFPILYFLVLLILPGMIGGCKKVEDGLSALTWQINFDLIKTTWDIQFIDGSSGLPVGANSEERIEMTITGNDAGNIIDLAGIRQPRFYSTKGFAALALHPDRAAVEPATPVRFVIQVNHPGYLPVTVPVIAYHGGINPIRIYLTSRQDAPENVDLAVHQASGMLSGGSLTDTLAVNTPLSRAAIHLDAGTALVATDGTQLSGDLTVTLSHWEGGTTGGLKTFPGGQITLSSAGNPGLIYLAGGAYVEMRDQDGRLATSLSKPIRSEVAVSSLAYHPITRTILTPGQSVPVWHLNSETGIWDNQNTVITEIADGELIARFSMYSPGLYLLGWINENLCSNPLVMRPGTLPEYDVLSYAFTVNVFELFENELRFIRTAGLNGPVSSDYELRLLPDQSEILLRFEAYTGELNPYYRNPDPLLLAGFCESGGPVEFELLPRPNSTYKKIEVVFIDVAHNNTRYNPKVFPGYYRKTGTTIWQSAFVYDGQAYIVNPEVGAVYEMGINFKGRFQRKEVTVGAEEVILVEIAID